MDMPTDGHQTVSCLSPLTLNSTDNLKGTLTEVTKEYGHLREWPQGMYLTLINIHLYIASNKRIPTGLLEHYTV